jgi:hypothetical protein
MDLRQVPDIAVRSAELGTRLVAFDVPRERNDGRPLARRRLLLQRP